MGQPGFIHVIITPMCDDLYTRLGFVNPLVGLPEVTFQMLFFAYLLSTWERRVERHSVLVASQETMLKA